MIRFSQACLAATALVSILTGGCTPAKRVSPAQVRDDYQAGRYREAYDGAHELIRDGSGGHRDEANFLAGMSAYRLGDAAKTMRHLNPLTDHADPRLAGPANATLGLVYANRSDAKQAVAHFQRAVRLLQGEDLAHAYYNLGLNEQRLGRHAQAKTHFGMAVSESRDPAFQKAVRQRLHTAGFTLQLGAYVSRTNADARARAMHPRAAKVGLQAPRVVPSKTASGVSLFLVQVGRFTTHEAAQKALRRMDQKNAVIVPLAGAR